MTDIRTADDPLKQTERRIKGFLRNYHELREMHTRPSDPSVVSSGRGFHPGAWWEGLACMRCDVRRALGELTERQREAIVRYYVMDDAQSQVARAMKCSQQNVSELVRTGARNMALALGGEW
jgi:DNA-directed RNA polymerase specialized sigma24 family protein